MAELEDTLQGDIGRSLFGFLVFGYLGEQDNHECQSKDGQSGIHERESVANLGIHNTGDEETGDNDDRSATKGVESAAELDELVALVATTAQTVEHGVDNSVEQAHTETGNEGTDEIYGETANQTRTELDAHTDKSYSHGNEGGDFIAAFLQEVASGYTHDGIGNEIGKNAQSTLPVGNGELVFQNIAHGGGEVGDEGYHAEEQYHHHNGDKIVLFLFHIRGDLNF